MAISFPHGRRHDAPVRYSAVFARYHTAIALDTASAESFRRDARVIGLVGVAHGLSHFLQLALPPLFPLLRAEFDVSWTLLGLLMGVFYAASGVTQFVAGFVVDRAGARPVLLGGMALVAGGTLLAAAVPDFAWLFPVVVLMGIGNGVFHPADFAILNSNVAPRRLGHAYSTHGVGGNLGYAAAPIVSFGLASTFGWRVALLAMGAAGAVMLGVLLTQRSHLGSHRASDAPGAALHGSRALLLQWPIVMCLLYFIVQTIGSGGIQSFAASSLHAGFDVALAYANTAVTAYLLGATAGIVTGGFLATRTPRFDLVAGAGLFAGALLALAVATGPPAPLLLPLFAAMGFAVGVTGPSRDLIVRSATPKGASGRIYGFVYSGLDIGSALGPVVFGVMLDHGFGRETFVLIAVLFLVAIGTVLQARRAIVAHAG
jgi:FSR family fosmidomycin resistance protein-like MFS transporter